MTAETIRQMCSTLPAPEDDLVRDNFRLRYSDTQVGIQDMTVARYASAYKDLQFGWHYARTMALNGLPLPVTMADRDQWVWRAYLYCLDPARYGDRTLQEAIMWMGPQFKKERSVIHALLVSSDMDLERVAGILKRPKDVLSAYEILFFNIFDRRKDDLFLSSIIYPEGRIVEAYQDYTVNEALDVLLLRAGYNNGAPHVLHLAGFPNELVAKFLSSDTPGRFEALVMANGMLMAMNGFMNQGPHVSMGMRMAIQLLSAAKAGGQDDKQSPFQQSAGQVMMAEVQRVKSAQHQLRVGMNYIQAGEKRVGGRDVKTLVEASAN